MELSDLKTVILASASPARAQVLRDNNLNVIQCPTGSDEHTDKTEPGEVVQSLAAQKMDAYLKEHGQSNCAVITCDTLVYLEGKLIGKPAGEEAARRQLESFSGKVHSVYTGYCLLLNGKRYEGSDRADVCFKTLDEGTIEHYLASGEYKGAAGSYRIQGKAAAFVKEVTGDIDTVIGIPTQILKDIVRKSAS